jgi:hypothetical protein
MTASLSLLLVSGLMAAAPEPKYSLTLHLEGLDKVSSKAGKLDTAIEVRSWSFGSGFDREKKKNAVQDLVVTKQSSPHSPLFAELAMTSARIPRVVFQVALGGTVMQLELFNVRISQYQVGGSSSSPAPDEQLALSFERAVYSAINKGVVTTSSELKQ